MCLDDIGLGGLVKIKGWAVWPKQHRKSEVDFRVRQAVNLLNVNIYHEKIHNQSESSGCLLHAQAPTRTPRKGNKVPSHPWVGSSEPALRAELVRVFINTWIAVHQICGHTNRDLGTLI